MRRFATTVVLGFVLASTVLAFGASKGDTTIRYPLPTIRDVAPDTLPLDVSEAASLKASPSATLRKQSAVSHAFPVKVWTCGAPHALAQGSGSVSDCSYEVAR